MLTSSLLASVQRSIGTAHGDLDAIDASISEAALAAARADGDIVTGLLTTAGINARVSAVLDSHPIPVWRDQQVVVVCELDQWPKTMEALGHWSSDERELAGLSGRVTAIPAENGELLPFGLRFYGAGNILPVLTDVVEELGRALGEPMRGNTIRTVISVPCDALVAYSYQRVREQERDSTWVRVPPTAETPGHVRESLQAILSRWANRNDLTDRDDFAVAAVELALALCDVVEAEDPRGGLAAQVAAIDIHTLAAPVPGSAAQLLNAVQIAALEADGASPS
jgi:hypothetical protein